MNHEMILKNTNRSHAENINDILKTGSVNCLKN